VLAWAPDSLTAKGRKVIRAEVIAQIGLVTDACAHPPGRVAVMGEGMRRGVK
jgi:hypothetical protein